MSRTFGGIYVTIWENPDFVALSSEAQRAYFMLISQPRIDAAGVQSIAMKRWSQLSRNDLASLQDAMRELVSAKFVLVDVDTEEILVRTFIKWDNRGFANFARRAAIKKAYHACASETLRGSILAAMTDLGYDFEGPIGTPYTGPTRTPGRTPRRTPARGPSESDVLEPEPEPEPTTLLEPAVRGATIKPIIDRAFVRFWEVYPKRAGKQAAYRRFDTAVRAGDDPAATAERIIEGAVAYAEVAKTTDPRFVKMAEGWIHAGRWEDEEPVPQAPAPPPVRAVRDGELPVDYWSFAR